MENTQQQVAPAGIDLPDLAAVAGGIFHVCPSHSRGFGRCRWCECPPGDGQGDVTRLCLDNGNLPASFDAGMAYRPLNKDHFNMLGKYTFLYDLDSSAQADAGTDKKSHVLSLEGLYDLARRIALGSKLAWKRGEVREDRDEGNGFHTDTRLAVIRSRYHITRAWDALEE